MNKVELHLTIQGAMAKAAHWGNGSNRAEGMKDLFDSPEYRQLEKYLTEEESC